MGWTSPRAGRSGSRFRSTASSASCTVPPNERSSRGKASEKRLGSRQIRGPRDRQVRGRARRAVPAPATGQRGRSPEAPSTGRQERVADHRAGRGDVATEEEGVSIYEESASPTRWAVLCPEHGRVYLTRVAYTAQLSNANARWKCPHWVADEAAMDMNSIGPCGAVSEFDDETYEEDEGP